VTKYTCKHQVSKEIWQVSRLKFLPLSTNH